MTREPQISINSCYRSPAEPYRTAVRDLLAAHGAERYYAAAILPVVQTLGKGK